MNPKYSTWKCECGRVTNSFNGCPRCVELDRRMNLRASKRRNQKPNDWTYIESFRVSTQRVHKLYNLDHYDRP